MTITAENFSNRSFPISSPLEAEGMKGSELLNMIWSIIESICPDFVVNSIALRLPTHVSRGQKGEMGEFEAIVANYNIFFFITVGSLLFIAFLL